MAFRRSTVRSRSAPPNNSPPLVAGHRLRLREDVSLRRALEVGLARSGLQIEGGIEGVELEIVAMLAARRTRAAIRILAKAGAAHHALRRLSLSYRGGVRWDVPHDPVIERAARRVGIIHHQRQRLRILGDV